MTKKEKEKYDKAIKTCKQVLAMAKGCLNCGVCGGEPGHDADCPVPLACEALGCKDPLEE